jgi:hypothetical protein
LTYACGLTCNSEDSIPSFVFATFANITSPSSSQYLEPPNKFIISDEWRPKMNRKFRHVIKVIQIRIKHLHGPRGCNDSGNCKMKVTDLRVR